MADSDKKGILVLSGITGLVGSEVRRQLMQNSNVETIVTTLLPSEIPSEYKENVYAFDLIKNPISNIEKIIKKHNIKSVINCIAASNVDWCEDEFETAKKINGYFPGELAKICGDNDIHLVHISTDYVFDGINGNYNETSPTSPVSRYGESKLLGDELIIKSSTSFTICRTSTVFGPYNIVHSNYMLKTLNNLKDNKEVPVFTDQITSPTYTVNLASMLIEAALKSVKGLVNTAGADQISRLDAAETLIDVMFAKEKKEEKMKLIKHVLMKDVVLKAIRPKHSTLNISKAMQVFEHKPMTLKIALENMKKILG